MLRHYMISAFRNFTRNKTYSIINIIGLTVGLAVAITVAKYVGFSLTIDNFQENRTRILAIHQKEFMEGQKSAESNDTYANVGPAAVASFPEVEDMTRIAWGSATLITYTGNNGKVTSLNQDGIWGVDSTFFNLFDFPVKYGSLRGALSGPHSMIITESVAEKFFGNRNPVGSTLSTQASWGPANSSRITCVLYELPENSSLQFKILVPFRGDESMQNIWTDFGYGTYLLVSEKCDVKRLEKKMSAVIGVNGILRSEGKRIEFSLDRLGRIRFSDKEALLILIGLLALIISWINFISLSVGMSLGRIKETGVRKAIGAARSEIVFQFIIETLMINFIAFVLALAVFGLIVPYWMDIHDGYMLPLLGDPTIINWLIFFLFITGAILSSLYPSIVLSASDAIHSMRGKMLKGNRSISMRKLLVILQFSLTVVACIGIYVISDQMHFMQNRDLKFDMNRILVIRAPRDGFNGKFRRMNTFKEEAARLSMISGVASTNTPPGTTYLHEVYCSPVNRDTPMLFYMSDVDEDFFGLYKIKFLSGKNFSAENPAINQTRIILNRSAARKLGYDNPDLAIGKKIKDYEENTELEITGIVEDYHQLSLKEEIEPQVYRFNRRMGDISLKVNAYTYSHKEDMRNCIASLRKIWKDIYRDLPFEYYFLDDHYNAQYLSDIKFEKLFSVFSGISIFIACSGLFGLSLFVSVKRRKEVGVRKVFGASSLSILVLFVRDYLRQLLVAVCIGAPFGYILMSNWLTHYRYRISVNGLSILIPSLILTILFLLTIAYHIIRSALVNPAVILKEE